MLDVANRLSSYMDSLDQQEGSFPIGGLGIILLRYSKTIQPVHLFNKPRLCIPLRGAKLTLIGKQRFECPTKQALLTVYYGPGTSTISPRALNEPFLGISLELDLAELRRLSEKVQCVPSRGRMKWKDALIIDLSPELADCAARIVGSLEDGETLEVLYPGIQREISYWLLKGPAAQMISHFLRARCTAPHIGKALSVLDRRYREPLHVKELAAAAGMSQSAFHQQFRLTTSMSPIQYQKQLRLVHARRLLIEGEMNVEEAARIVGYISPSQFSRDYSKRFGESPKRDAALVKKQRQVLAELAS